jgi:hypothetical protein
VHGIMALLNKEGVEIMPDNAREIIGAPVQLIPEMVLFVSEHEITDAHMMAHLEGEEMQQYLKERVCVFLILVFKLLCLFPFFFFFFLLVMKVVLCLSSYVMM